MAVFRTSSVPNFWLVQQGLNRLESMYPAYLGISKIRIDSDAAHPVYQVEFYNNLESYYLFQLLCNGRTQ
jgi:hypothetical protein